MLKRKNPPPSPSPPTSFMSLKRHLFISRSIRRLSLIASRHLFSRSPAAQRPFISKVLMARSGLFGPLIKNPDLQVKFFGISALTFCVKGTHPLRIWPALGKFRRGQIQHLLHQPCDFFLSFEPQKGHVSLGTRATGPGASLLRRGRSA